MLRVFLATTVRSGFSSLVDYPHFLRRGAEIAGTAFANLVTPREVSIRSEDVSLLPARFCFSRQVPLPVRGRRLDGSLFTQGGATIGGKISTSFPPPVANVLALKVVSNLSRLPIFSPVSQTGPVWKNLNPCFSLQSKVALRERASDPFRGALNRQPSRAFQKNPAK